MDVEFKRICVRPSGNVVFFLDEHTNDSWMMNPSYWSELGVSVTGIAPNLASVLYLSHVYSNFVLCYLPTHESIVLEIKQAYEFMGKPLVLFPYRLTRQYVLFHEREPDLASPSYFIAKLSLVLKHT
jgi:hypothetical protein